MDSCCEVISGRPQQDSADAFPVAVSDFPQQDDAGTFSVDVPDFPQQDVSGPAKETHLEDVRLREL